MSSNCGLGDEFEGLALGDERLNRRARLIAEKAMEAPEKSFPKMVENPSELEALYRFFQNDEVNAADILEPHRQATAHRSNGQKLIRAVHDTTTFAFNGDRQGLGALGSSQSRGFLAHLGLSVSGNEERDVLGVLAFRPFFNKATRAKDGTPYKLPREKKLSLRWFEAAREVAELGLTAEVIHVMDQEADSYALFAELMKMNARFVIRGSTNRRLGADLSYKLGDRLQCARTMDLQTVVLSPRLKAKDRYPKRAERKAQLQVRATRVTLPRPPEGQTEVESLNINVVQVFEPRPPPGEEAIEWILFTTEPIDSFEGIRAIVDHYRSRWRVEEFFRVVKTGCSIERRQLTEGDALIRALALFIPIAWRLLAMRILARRVTPVAATVLFSEEDLDVIRFLATRRKHPFPARPNIRDAMLAIAAIGGHLKRNGDPGWITITRGYADFCLAREIWVAKAE